MGKTYCDIKFQYPRGLEEIRDMERNEEILLTLRFHGENPRTQTLKAWRDEISANRDDYRYGNLWDSICRDLERDFQQRNAPSDQASKLMKMVLDANIELFHDERKEPYALIPLADGGHDCISLDQRSFEEFLAHQFYLQDGRAPGSAALSDALRALRGKARFEGEEHPLVPRVAEHSGAFYYDLCNEGRAVKISQDGWTITDSPIVFRRFQHMLRQVEPNSHPNGSLDRFVRMWHLASHDHEDMLKVVLGCLLVPNIPKTGLGLHGPPGSAKSLLTRAIKQIIDPSSITNQKLPSKEDELKRQLSKHHLCTFDNVRNMTGAQADVLCNAITGGTTSSRALYTNDDDFYREIRTAIIVNGVNLEITESDLLDRFLTLEMSVIPTELRRPEKEILAEIEAMIPDILGELFDHLSRAMLLKSTIEVKDKPRMADWYEWAICFAEAMEMGHERFERIFADYQERQNEYAIENDIVASVLASYIQEMTELTYVAGTPTQIMQALTRHAEDSGVNIRVSAWPKTAPEFSKSINKVKKNLAADGIWVIDCNWRDLVGHGIETLGMGMYRKEDRIKIITTDRKPFKQMQNGRLDEPDSWGKSGQQSEQNRKTGKTGFCAYS